MGAVTNLNRNPPPAIDARATDSVSAQSLISRREPLVFTYVVLVLFAVIFWARPQDWIPGLSYVPLEKIMVILAVLGLVFSLRHIRSPIPRESVFLFFLIVQLIVASLMSPVWRGGALQSTLDFSKVLIIVVIIMAAVTTLQRLRVLIFTQAICVSAVAIVTIWKGRLLLGRLEGLLGGNYTDPNDLALAMAISLPLCLALLFLSKNWLWKIFWLTSMLVMIVAVFLTGSRGGFFTLVVVAAACLWEFAVRGRRRYLLLVAVLVAVILWQFSGGMLVGRLKGTFNVNEDKAAAYDSGQQRQQLFWRSIEVTIEHPFFGVGPGNFMQLSGSWHATHNSFTQMSSEGGVPALILYVFILLGGFKNCLAAKRLARGQVESGVLARALFASLVGYAIGSSFLTDAYMFFPYIIVAYTTTLLLIVRKSIVQSRQCESVHHVAVEEQSHLETPDFKKSWHAT